MSKIFLYPGKCLPTGAVKMENSIRKPGHEVNVCIRLTFKPGRVYIEPHSLKLDNNTKFINTFKVFFDIVKGQDYWFNPCSFKLVQKTAVFFILYKELQTRCLG